MRMKWLAMMLSAVAVLPVFAGDELAGPLVVFHAGSLAKPFADIAKGFQVGHPKVEMRMEAAGSRDCARKITDLKRPCDVMASADYLVIDQLLIPDAADWNIRFACNEMAIVFDGKSRRAQEIDSNNWYKILLDPKVAFGRADPNADPCGYRAVLTMQLAEKFYGRPGLTAKLTDKDTQFIRPKEVDLLALLESGSIDYLFLYKSVAAQHGLKYVVLPDEINLKNPEFADAYAGAKIDLTGKKPGETIVQKGEAMVYGITIPKSSPNPRAAIAFVQYVLSADKGMAIMERAGQPSAVPSPCDRFEMLPVELKPFALPPGKNKEGR